MEPKMIKIISYLLISLSYLYSTSISINTNDSSVVKIDSELFKKLDGEYYEEIQIKNRKVLFVYTNGMVNKCGVLLVKDNKSNIYSQYFSKNEICNPNIIDNIFISSYRDKSQWFYKYFEIDDNTLFPVRKEFSLNYKTLTTYNNIAYHLQKAGANEEAAYLLEKIIVKFPNRTVAYYNLGDAYWALGEKKKAIKAYTTYIEQMCHKGLQKKIPKEVLERVKDKR
jgi:tetratricopeptide (TPR) repeat protein